MTQRLCQSEILPLVHRTQSTSIQHRLSVIARPISIIAPYFFRNDIRDAVAIDGHLYRAILTPTVYDQISTTAIYHSCFSNKMALHVIPALIRSK